MTGRRPLTSTRVRRSLARRANEVRRRFMPSFRRGLEDPTVSLSLDMERDSGTLLIAFGGIQGGLQIPPFEFLKVTGAFPIKRMFVRDLNQAWYHRGVHGHGSNIPELAASLRQVIAPYDVDRVVVTGTSMGGYAALLLGSMLGAETALSFAPQTTLDRGQLAEMEDHRWDSDLDRIELKGPLDPRWIDLRHALPEVRGTTRCEVLFDPANELDRKHCERIADLDGVRLIPREGGGHNLARDMRDTGELDRLLRAALDGSPSRH